MYAYILRRILTTVPVMGVVAVAVFLLLHLTPGDPATVIAGDYAQPEDIARIRAQLGLDQPLYIQFFTWIGAVLSGDLGVSIFSNLPVTKLIGQRLEPTLALAVATIVFAVVIAVPLGVIAAWRAGTFTDRAIMVFSVLGFSVPVFVIGYAMMWGLSLKLGWFPVQGYKPIAEGFGPFLRSIALPTIALGIIYIALIARITRASVLEVLTEDYIRTARAKGLDNRALLIRHALKNAAVPIVTIIGIGIALLIGGVVVTESVFNIPGLGRLTIDAVLRRDYPVIQGVILLFSGVFVVVNLLIDLSYTVLDPRIRY
ncbi:MAG: ABC transporter permease [Alphaproteobacteria bacterium]|jgi:peptide/nickel transport system permease protein|nr:ABC transporter permease [Alphaproteobacteria bacterium]MDP6565985.1 ABC transporter permease [Alphaproteobacteria bacterium]